MKVKDFLVTGEEFELVYDETYGFLKTTPAPAHKDLQRYYDSAAYISHTDSQQGLIPALYQSVKKYTLSKKLKLVTAQNRGPGSLLDIGAGTGEFIKLAESHGWNVSGVEPNYDARTLSMKKGIHLFESIDELEGQQFDVVTLWHVLEHLPNLEETIDKMVALVKQGGSLIIAVPNYNSFDAKYYKEFWAAYDAPRHLWHFSRKSMSILFKSKMKLKMVKPMIFDSYYVSLLSEKYKSGNAFSLKALLIGFWSNVSAWRTNEYSSLVYCFKCLIAAAQL